MYSLCWSPEDTASTSHEDAVSFHGIFSNMDGLVKQDKYNFYAHGTTFKLKRTEEELELLIYDSSKVEITIFMQDLNSHVTLCGYRNFWKNKVTIEMGSYNMEVQASKSNRKIFGQRGLFEISAVKDSSSVLIANYKQRVSNFDNLYSNAAIEMKAVELESAWAPISTQIPISMEEMEQICLVLFPCFEIYSRKYILIQNIIFTFVIICTILIFSIVVVIASSKN